MSFWNHELCPFCTEPLGTTHGQNCILPPPWDGVVCRICGQPLLGEAGEDCWFCRRKSWSLDRSFFAFPYRDRWKLLLQEYKIQKHWYLGKFIAFHMAPLIVNPWPLVPVPGNPRGNRERGFDPVNIICREIRRKLKNPVLEVFRRKPGKSQKNLGKDERQSSIKGGILLRENLSSLPQEVYLIDDIFTTGATAQHCSELLKSQGVKTVVLIAAAGP